MAFGIKIEEVNPTTHERRCDQCDGNALVIVKESAWCSWHWLERCGLVERAICSCLGCRAKRFGFSLVAISKGELEELELGEEIERAS